MRRRPQRILKRGSIALAFLIFSLMLSTLLSGCAPSPKQKITRTKKDGPPPYIPCNLDKVPDAKPMHEPLSRCGNRFKKGNTYVTFKKRYKVLPTSRHYRAKGIASWYGTQFHGRKTSSGEPYDMFAMTAAHRTLPLPTYAKIRNLDNGKTAIVKINDRGPFHGNRLIDLSYVAAHKLGIIATGTARVEVVSVDPRDHRGSNFAKHQLGKDSRPDLKKQMKAPGSTQVSSQGSLPEEKLNKSKLFVQLGKYQHKSAAVAILKKVGPIAKTGALIRTVKSKQSTHFLVRLGPFPNTEAAQALQQKLGLLNLATTVVSLE